MLPSRGLAAIACAVVACSNPMTEIDPDVRAQLIPTGELRVAVAVGPTVSATFATRDAAGGELSGPTITLGAALAERLGVPVRYVAYASSGQITTAGARNEWDVTFVPVDDERAQVIDFGPDYSLFDSTFLIRAGLEADTIRALDAVGRVVGAVANTTTARAAERTLERAEVETHASVEALRDLLADGAIDAVALSRLSLTSLARDLPGTHILEESFHSTATAIAVPKGRTAALGFVTDFIEAAKASGLARRALDEAGLGAARVAPPAEG